MQLTLIVVKVRLHLVIGITEVCSHLPLASLCHSMYSLKATRNQLSGHQNHFHNQPKILRSYPIHRVICVVLYDGPSSIISVHVTVDVIRGKGTSPCYRVNTRRSQVGLISVHKHLHTTHQSLKHKILACCDVLFL